MVITVVSISCGVRVFKSESYQHHIPVITANNTLAFHRSTHSHSIPSSIQHCMFLDMQQFPCFQCLINRYIIILVKSLVNLIRQNKPPTLRFHESSTLVLHPWVRVNTDLDMEFFIPGNLLSIVNRPIKQRFRLVTLQNARNYTLHLIGTDTY